MTPNGTMARTIRLGTAAAVAVACLALAALGCSKTEQAAPIEVTYYYLPG